MNKTDKLALIFKESLDTYKAKNADYGDSFSKSFQEFGLTAPIVRMSDKLERLKSLSKADAQVKDESKRDTLIDLGNYAFMTVVEMDIEDEKTKASEEELKDVIDERMENAEKIKKESLNAIMQTLERINGVGINDKLEVNTKLLNGMWKSGTDYTEGDKLNI